MKRSIVQNYSCLWAGLGFFLLASCSVHVDPLSDEQLNEAAATELAEMFAPGERVTHPLSLDDVIERAVLNNLENRLLRLEQSFALAQVDVDSMEMLPTLAASAGYTNRTRENFSTSQVQGEAEPSGSFSRSRDTENTTNSLSTTWNVLDFTIGYYGARQAGNRAFIAEERARRAGMDIIRDARQTFWSAYAAQQLSATISSTIAEARAVLASIEEGERSGAIPAVDALRSRRTVLENVRQLEIFSNELAAAQIELAQLVNVRPGSIVTLGSSEMSIPSLPGSLTELEARAFTSNPALREQQYRINIALDDVRRTTAQLFPDLSLSAEANYDADAFLLNNRWNQFGLTAGWNLIRLMTAPQRINLSERGVEVERARALAVRMAVLAQAHIAYRDFHFARAQFQRARDLAEIDRRLAQQSRAREEASVGSQVELIVVETSSLISQLRVFDAYGQLVAAYSAVLSSIGADGDLRQILEQDRQDRALAIEALEAAENEISLENANLEHLGRQETRIQRNLERAIRAHNRALASRDRALAHRDEMQAIVASSIVEPDSGSARRTAAKVDDAETELARREEDLLAATQAVETLTQELAALESARIVSTERLALARVAREAAEQRSALPSYQ